jgi:hypothetical protein
MTTALKKKGWTVRCDRCKRCAPVAESAAADALKEAAATYGWERQRPGVDDICPDCFLKF